MPVHVLKAYFNSTKAIDVFNATHDVKRGLRESQVLHGLLTVFSPGSTAGIALLENDPKVHGELKDLISSFVMGGEGASPGASPGARPVRKSGSGSSEAHLRGALLSQSISIPIKDGKLLMGAWQEVIVFDFDDKIGRREILIHVMGEGEEKKNKQEVRDQ